jgi:hypothetical protein
MGMTAFFRRLQPEGIEIPLNHRGTWTFSEDLRKSGAHFSTRFKKNRIDFFRYFAKNHQLLQLEYSVHCTQLAQDLLYQQDEADRQKLIQQIEAALLMAELLDYLYTHYLNISHEVSRLRKEQEVYRDLLTRANVGYQFPSQVSKPSKQDSLVNKVIRELTLPTNLVRLFITRTRRLMVIMIPIISDYTRYTNLIREVDQIANPFLSYAAWVFFIPRLCTNLYYTAKHVIPGFWMTSQEERELGAWTRFRAQMERRWFELFNDAAAVTVNILTCFLLIGGLTPIGIYLTLGLLTYDVVLASVRAYMEMNRLRAIEKDYQAMLEDESIPEEERVDISKYLGQLQNRIAFEQKRLYTQVAITVVLVLAFSLTIPLFAFTPMIPIIGAAIAVLTTMAFYVAIKCLEKKRPTAQIDSKLIQHSIFKPIEQTSYKPDDDPDLTDALIA